jgi:glucokinase
MASGTAMLEWARANSVEAHSLPALDARLICELAESRVNWAVQAVQREGYYLGIGLANLITLFAPDAIALGGGVMRRWQMFEPYAMQVVRERSNLIPAGQVQITRALLGDDAPLIGAGQVWLHQFRG